MDLAALSELPGVRLATTAGGGIIVSDEHAAKLPAVEDILNKAEKDSILGALANVFRAMSQIGVSALSLRDRSRIVAKLGEFSEMLRQHSVPIRIGFTSSKPVRLFSLPFADDEAIATALQVIRLSENGKLEHPRTCANCECLFFSDRSGARYRFCSDGCRKAWHGQLIVKGKKKNAIYQAKHRSGVKRQLDNQRAHEVRKLLKRCPQGIENRKAWVAKHSTIPKRWLTEAESLGLLKF